LVVVELSKGLTKERSEVEKNRPLCSALVKVSREGERFKVEKSSKALATVGIPDFDRFVVGPGDDGASMDCDGVDPIRMAFQRSEALALGALALGRCRVVKRLPQKA